MNDQRDFAPETNLKPKIEILKSYIVHPTPYFVHRTPYIVHRTSHTVYLPPLVLFFRKLFLALSKFIFSHVELFCQ